MNRQKRFDGRHQRKEDNKQKAVEIMLDLVLETGKMPDVEEIIKRSGISRRSFFRFFKNEGARVSEINRLMSHRVFNRFEGPVSDPDRPLEETLRLFVDFKAQIDEYRLPLRKLTDQMAATSPEATKTLKTNRKVWLQYINELFSPHLEQHAQKNILLKHIHFNTSWSVWAMLREDHEMDVADCRLFIERQLLAILNARIT